MSPERWRFTGAYLREVFGQLEDPALEASLADARAAGLPDIAVSVEVGRLLSILAGLVGARVAIEVGTLGGFSTTFLARAMPAGARLYTIEREPRFADLAERTLARAGVADRVEVLRGDAAVVLPALAATLGPGSVDLVFLDADKRDYLAQARLAVPLLRRGGLLVADNVLGTSGWWIDALGHPEREGADALNRWVAAHPELEATAAPLREGVLIARRR